MDACLEKGTVVMYLMRLPHYLCRVCVCVCVCVCVFLHLTPEGGRGWQRQLCFISGDDNSDRVVR